MGRKKGIKKNKKVIIKKVLLVKKRNFNVKEYVKTLGECSILNILVFSIFASLSEEMLFLDFIPITFGLSLVVFYFLSFDTEWVELKGE